MSKLNANAFSFVPGQSFKYQPPPQQQQQPPAPNPALVPIERPPQEVAPAPAQTITLNIGGSKPTPPATPPPAQKVNPQVARVAPAQTRNAPTSPSPTPPPSTVKLIPPTSSSPAPGASSVFTLERAKTDTTSIVQEVLSVADESTLKDLYGHGAPTSFRSSL